MVGLLFCHRWIMVDIYNSVAYTHTPPWTLCGIGFILSDTHSQTLFNVFLHSVLIHNSSSLIRLILMDQTSKQVDQKNLKLDTKLTERLS